MSTRQQSEVSSGTRSGSMARQTLRLSVEVRSGTARFRIGAQARSIREALGMVEGRYPEGEVKVAFPIGPDGSFVRGFPLWWGWSTPCKPTKRQPEGLGDGRWIR